MLKEKMLRTIIAMISLSFLIAGCATSKTMDAYKDSGFLPDYTRLKPAPDDKDARVWRVPDKDLVKYNKILLERITVYIKDDAKVKAIDPTEIKALTDYFHDSIVKALGKEYPVVTEPGPDVMRIRIAITQLVPTQTDMSVVMLVVPYATVADLASSTFSKGGTGSPPYIGDAAIEAMGLDSMTNDLLFEFVERKIGKKYDVNMSGGAEEAVVKGYSNYFKSYEKWGYTKQAFDYWAQRFKEKLDEIHGKKPA